MAVDSGTYMMIDIVLRAGRPEFSLVSTFATSSRLGLVLLNLISVVSACPLHQLDQALILPSSAVWEAQVQDQQDKSSPFQSFTPTLSIFAISSLSIECYVAVYLLSYL